MPAACFLQNVMQPETRERDTSGNTLQEFLENTLLSKLVCFFCDKEYPGVQVLHSHQNECAQASNSQKILTDTKNNVGKKRTFLSCLHLVPKVTAEQLIRSEKRKDVVLDVIVIDDDSDDESKDVTEDKSQRYLLSPNKLDLKTKLNGRLRSKSKSNGLAQGSIFAKPSSKVFKFDISSPLGMRLRCFGQTSGDCRLPISKIITTKYEQYCGTSAKRTSHLNRCYHVTYRKSRQPSKFFHKYKFTRSQLRASCMARRSGLCLNSLRLRQQMKPCRILLEKLNLPCDDGAKGTFDARKYVQMSNLPAAAEGFTEALDKDVGGNNMQNTVDKCETVIVPISRFLNNVGGVQGLELHRSDIERMMNLTKHPVTKIGAYESYNLRKSDARSTVDVCSPVVDFCPGVFGSVNKNFKDTQAFARNVEFVRLAALDEQNVFEVENHDPQNQMFQISSVYSLAKCLDNESNSLTNNEHTSESIVHSVENTLPLSSSAGSADVITITDHDNAPREAEDKSLQIPERQSTVHHAPVSASNVIDLTETVSSSPADDCETNVITSRGTSVESNTRKTSGVLRDISQQISEKLCTSRSVDESQNPADVKKVPLEKSSAQQISSHLLKEPERPIVIEIPDEDSAVSAELHINYATQLRNNNNYKNLVNSDRATTLPSQRVPPTWHSVQPTIQSGVRNGVPSSDTIDLSFDSDSEALDKQTVAPGKKRLLSSNLDCCPPRKRDRPGLSLERSSLPPLTFKCHICSSFFNFDSNAGTMIQKHYLMHNVTNIELVKQVLPSGQTAWSLVELNNGHQSTHSKLQAASTSVPRTSVWTNRVGTEVSVTRPALTIHYSPPIASSSRSAVLEGNTLPEFISLEEAHIPETLSSNPEKSDAKKPFSPNATRVNSETNCNVLPVRHAQSVLASNVSISQITSSITNDTVLAPIGGQERNDVLPVQNRTIDVNTLGAMHLPQLRPNAPNSAHVFVRPVPGVRGGTPTEPKRLMSFPTSANFNRVIVGRGSGDASDGNQTKKLKRNLLASLQSNNNIIHGVICLD